MSYIVQPDKSNYPRSKMLFLLLVFTDVVTGSTIRVNDTFGFAASNGVGVGDQTGFTSANWVSAGSNGANSSRTARAGITGVRSLNTFLLFTNIISGAIGVNDTFGSASSNGIGFGDQTGFTSENNIVEKLALQKYEIKVFSRQLL